MERGQGKPSLELLVEISLYFHVSTDYLLLGRELDRDSVRASLLELSAQMTELAGKL
jgi:transcriptional regulator with XRE-family HTH domain